MVKGLIKIKESDDMDDNKIIKLYQQRCEKAISETAQKYGRYCHYIAFNILQNHEDSEECVNDTYLRAWNSIPPKHPKKLQIYLGKITRNLSLNKYEKITAQKRSNGQVGLILDELLECIPDKESEEYITDDMVIKETIEAFLERLPAEVRKIFVHRYWFMSSVKEIAKEYGITESKVTVTLFRTREKLKTVLEKEGIII